MANLIVLVSHFDGRSQIPTEYLTYKAFHDLQDLEIWTTYLPSAHMNSQASTHINILTDVHSHAYTNIVINGLPIHFLTLSSTTALPVNPFLDNIPLPLKFLLLPLYLHYMFYIIIILQHLS